MTSSDPLRERIDSLRNCGRRPAMASAGWAAVQSGNYRLSEWQAAVLAVQFTRFPEQLQRRAENARRLDETFAVVEGVAPMRRRPEMTRQGLYGYVLRYDSAAFDGLPVQEFRTALSGLSGAAVGSVYEPLNCSPLYQPQTKARHRIPGQWDRINPRGFELPVATRAYAEESIVINHEVLLSEWGPLAQLVDMIEAIRARGQDAVRHWKRGGE
jgi:L-glutamine:2-deoxy-scyllo-inosose/3-amino-2,3-dideoxy-scyllo-inosose aminotransferase